MKFGVFSVSMPEYDMAQSVALLKELGYDAIEWRVAEMPEKEPENVPFERRYWAYNKSTLEVRDIMNQAKKAKALCDEAGISVTALTTYLSTGDKENIEAVFAAAAAIGCPMVRVGLCGFMPNKSEDTYPVAFDKMRENVKTVEAVARANGVKAVLEIHMDTLISSPSAAYRALEGFDPDYVGLIFDPGNMVNEGFEDYLKSFQLLGKYIAHVHIKNGVLAADGVDEFGAAKWVRTWAELDKGMANLYNLFCVMKKTGYTGSISIEDFSNERETKEKLAKNLAYLKKLEAVADADKAF